MHPFSAPWKHKKTVKFSDEKKGAFGTNGLKKTFLLGFFAKIEMDTEAILAIHCGFRS